MYDFSKIHAECINKNFLLSKVSEEQIFYYYFGKPFKLGDRYNSPFRKDKDPSTGFYINKSGILTYNDLRTGEKLDCVAFVAKLYNISYSQAIKRIAADFGLINSDAAVKVDITSLKPIEGFDKEQKKETIIQIVPGKWDKRHLGYWRIYDINEDELKRERIYPVKELYINKTKIGNKDNNIRFAYLENYKGKEYLKIYTPDDKINKWISNIPLHIPFGLEDLDYSSDTIYITKSKKDLVLLKKLFKSVIATQNESASSLPPDVVEHLCNSFKNRIIIWDNDETGVENCKEFNSKGFGYFNIPIKEYNKYRIKDPSDYVQYYGIDALEELFKQKGIYRDR